MSKKQELEKKINLLEKKIVKENELIEKSISNVKALTREKELLLKELKGIEALELLDLLKDNGISMNELKELIKK